jgi:hypothetical protein
LLGEIVPWHIHHTRREWLGGMGGMTMRPVDPTIWDRANVDERMWELLSEGGTWRLEQFTDFWCGASEFAAEIERWALARGPEAATHVEGRVVYVCLGEEAEEARTARENGLDGEAKKRRAKRWEMQQWAWEQDTTVAAHAVARAAAS